ncbi:hypothetical protein Clacol_000216 [Clathrus columnatus]|uniref:Uncharacterized protein n=1 Tax=Clathrus columnatus TaxID=1419009 RepID=A0AAV4ZWC9_9AGAM|nr:hypothetical protein Clacol_000216 [Clathrus columnatus]
MSNPEHYIFPSPVLKQIADSQDFVDQNLSRLVADSTSVGTTLSNFIAARTQEFIKKSPELKTDAEESIAAAADIARGQTNKSGDFFHHFITQLKQCSWTINDSDAPVSAQNVTSRDAQRVVDKELEKWLRLDYYLLEKLAIEGLESDISMPAKDALSALATKKDSDPATMEFMVGVLDFDISKKKEDQDVIVAFVYFTYELVDAVDLYGTKKCANVKTAYKSMSFNWKDYQEGQQLWVEKIFYTDDNPPQFTNERKHCIHELLLPNNIISLTDDVTNWVHNHSRLGGDKTYSVTVKQKADYENSAFNLVMLRCIQKGKERKRKEKKDDTNAHSTQVYGTVKRHAKAHTQGHRLHTLDIIAFLNVPLWGRVRLGSGSTVLKEPFDFNTKSKTWRKTFTLPGVAVFTLTFDLENDPELWCEAKIDGPLTGPLSSRVHILDVAV